MCTYIYMLAPPPRSTFSSKNHWKLQGIMKPLLFTTLLAMVFDAVFSAAAMCKAA